MSEPVVTMLSDLGSGSIAVSKVSAMLMAALPGVVLSTLSHHVQRGDVAQAAYLLASAYPHYPLRTLHLVMVGALEGSPALLLAEKDDHFFIAPDNGVLPLALGAAGWHAWRVCNWDAPYTFATWTGMAAAAARDAAAGLHMRLPQCTDYLVPVVALPRELPDGLDCNIKWIDRYENVVLDVTRSTFDAAFGGRAFGIRLRKTDDITVLSDNYNDVEVGAALCRFNNAGYLEIAVNHGKAAALLGIENLSAADTRYQTVRIFARKV